MKSATFRPSSLTPHTFFDKFDLCADAPDTVAKMRAHVRERQSQTIERQRRSIIQPRVDTTQEHLPWDNRKENINPKGVASFSARSVQPFQGWMRGGRVPRVARASQPWAEG